MTSEMVRLITKALRALEEEYGFAPARKEIVLMESDGDGNYILFRVGSHIYRIRNDKVEQVRGINNA